MNCLRCHFPLEPNSIQCPKCKSLWTGTHKSNAIAPDCVRLSEIESSEIDRLQTGPWDPVWGGGIVPNTVTLLGGSPGAGKSTLTLQLADGLADPEDQLLENPVLYIGCEEGLGQIKARASRIGLKNQEQIALLSTFGDNDIASKIERICPSAIILDSLSAYVGLGPSHDAESISVVTMLKEYAETEEAPVIIIDHVTKELQFAGLMMLQHLVDTTITLFPHEKDDKYRNLRTIKNRHGALVRMVSRMSDKGLEGWFVPHVDSKQF